MTIDTEIIKSAIDLRILAGEYTALSGRAEMVGACPKCGGTDRFHVKADSWFCRQCRPQWDDAIAFVQWIDGCSFLLAAERLGGPLPAVEQRKPVCKPIHKPFMTDEHKAIVEDAHKELIEQVGFGEGGEYLIKRGIEPPTWERFNLGFKADVTLPYSWDEKTRKHVYKPSPAIVMPWYRGGKLTGIRYRFLERHAYATAKGKSYTAKTTSHFESDFSGVLYGGQGLLGCAEDKRTLILCEGEINDMSIWQQCNVWNWDVLSLGSETSRLTPAAIAYACRYERVLVWMDRAEIARVIMLDIPGAYGVSSPNFGEIKRDANRMLVDGKLGSFLAAARFHACESDYEREHLLWNLHDAAHLPGGVDEQTMAIYRDMKGAKL